MAEIVAEHQWQKANPKTEAPQGEDDDIVKKVNKLLSQSKDATKDLRGKWADNYKFAVKGEQWSIRRPKWRWSEVFNITWSNIMTETGIQTDSAPKFDINGAEPSDMAFAEILKEINDKNWNKPLIQGFGWQRKTTAAIFKSKLYDVIHAEIGWNKKLSQGLGDVSYTVLDPFGCFWDTQADDISQCRYFIYAVPVPTAQLKKEYPDFAEKIKPDVNQLAAGSTSGMQHMTYNMDNGSFGASLAAEPIARGNKNAYGGEDMTLKIRCWLKDDTTLEELVPCKDGETEYVTKLKYPKGRYIEIVNNNKVKDEENEYEDGLFPIATLLNYDYGEYCGENEVTHFRGPQKIINYTMNHIMDQFKAGGAPQKYISEKAAHVADKITDEPGLKVIVPDVNDIRHEPGQGIAPGSINVLETAKSLADQVHGMQDASRGAPQPGVNSGLMLDGFVEAAQTRPRLKNRSVDEFMRQIGYLTASRYLQFYTAKRTFRITNKEGFDEFVEFNIDGEGDNRTVNISRQAYDKSGKKVGVPRQTTGSARGLPDIDIVAGSNLPYARAQKTATAGSLYDRNVITRLSYLEAIDWPNAKEEDKRVQEQQDAAIQAKAQAQVA